MIPPNLYFRSFSREERLESQQFKMTILTPVKSENAHQKKTSSLDGICFTYEQLFHPVQCTA